jgi:hypothetical protein
LFLSLPSLTLSRSFSLSQVPNPTPSFLTPRFFSRPDQPPSLPSSPDLPLALSLVFFFPNRCRVYVQRVLLPTLLLLADHQIVLSITYPLQMQVSNSISLNYQLLNFGLITRSRSLLALGLKVSENGTGFLPVVIAAAD